MATRPLGAVKQLTLTQVEEKVATVGRGKDVSVNVINAGSTFDVIGYTMTTAEAADRNLTRRKYVLEAGITAATYSKSLTGPMCDVGVEVTVFVGNVDVDIITASEAVS